MEKCILGLKLRYIIINEEIRRQIGVDDIIEHIASMEMGEQTKEAGESMISNEKLKADDGEDDPPEHQRLAYQIFFESMRRTNVKRILICFERLVEYCNCN